MNPRDLLPGNGDLKDMLAYLPRERRASDWEMVWMLVASLVYVIVGTILASSFGTMYRELGVQLPARTDEVLQLWFHLMAFGIQLLPIIWRYRSGPVSLATKVWGLCAMCYIGYVILFLFMPLVGVMSHMGGLGEQAS